MMQTYRCCLGNFFLSILPHYGVLSRGNSTYLWKYHTIKVPPMQYKSFMDAYNCIFEANFLKINENCAKLPETFRGDKFNAYFCGNFHRLSTLSGRESRYFGEILSPQKSVCGRISTFLMSGQQVYKNSYHLVSIIHHILCPVDKQVNQSSNSLACLSLLL